VWNDDWDGNPVVLNDHLFQGGENSWFYAFRLNRSYDSQRRVTVNPVNIIEQPGWTENLAALVGDRMFSIENSVALFRSFAFFANGGGLITGLDLSRISNRRAHRFFEFWAGDDIDSTITVDRDGQIYVAVERERRNRRNQEVGQLIKLNPFVSAPNQLVWSLKAPGSGAKGGFWATPALDSDRRVLYAPSHDGRLFAVHADTGQVLWEDSVGPHAWSSPVLVDGKLLLGLCSPGGLRLYDVSRPETKSVLWSIKHATGACIESTPAVWKGRFYVGSRDGYIYGFGAR
jgi:outer membrane protein assembly factor BamB